VQLDDRTPVLRVPETGIAPLFREERRVRTALYDRAGVQHKRQRLYRTVERCQARAPSLFALSLSQLLQERGC